MKSYKPTTPSRRHMTTVTYRGVITTNEPYKPLTSGFKRGVGRNAFGRITVQHKGGGHKRMLRAVDFLFDKKGVPAKVETIEYDPNRSGFIALVCYNDGERRYILAGKETKVGNTFIVSPDAPVIPGNRTTLSRIPVGTFVYNVELQANGGAKLARSAGNFVEVVAHNDGYTSLKMPSSEVRRVKDTCYATVGEVSNGEYNLRVIGKAGRARWMGIRPTVRGSVKNAVDHPYGGGEGKQPRGTRRPKTKHGKVTGGRKSRDPKKYSNVHIVSRRKGRLS